ncbi:MAG: 7-carboxy-7-deazaguanine synthase QueE [Asgard group archaeon]|nr:7-carboxy-7-deazaguanine synthase QueE [Asgard group archaeon]
MTAEKSLTATAKNTGYIVEIFSSYQGEGGSVRGSCFGRRQIFIRFAGCDLHCRWCDSAEARDIEYPTCRVETIPGSWDFESFQNPVTEDFVMDRILSLSTRDFHSVSLTGGEPTLQEEFFKRIIQRLYDLELQIFLETAGYFPQRIEQVASMISYACVDLKDRSAHSVKPKEWDSLVNKEFKALTILSNHSVKCFAKLVVTEDTKLADVRMMADKLREIVVPLVIQPVTPIHDIQAVSSKKLFAITETVAEVLPTDLFGISIQAHKIIDLL